MNLAGLDLNLLVVFDALMTERQVTRAGEKVGLSQPATSNALARLRHLTGDELFIRTRAGLHPTPLALALALQIQPALQQIQTALFQQQQPFDPQTSDRVFAIGMTDYMEFVILPQLLAKLEILAPQVKLQIRAGDRPYLFSLLDEGKVDFICGVFPEAVDWHEKQFLFQEQYVCVCRQDHPQIGDSLDLEDYLQAKHLLVSIKGDRVGRADYWLAERQLQREIALTVPHFLVAPVILAQTNLVATLAERVAQGFAQTQNLKIFPCPFPLEGFSVFMHWHQSYSHHPAQVWFRAIFSEVALTV